MKNKRIYRAWLTSALDILIALTLTGLTFYIVKMALDYVYRKSKNQAFGLVWDIWRFFKYEFLNGALVIVFVVAVFIFYYLLVTYKRTKS